MRKRIISLTTAILLTLSQASFAKSTIDTDYIKSILNLIEESYLYNTENTDYTDGALKGIFSTLDNYSNYYTEEEYKKLTENLTGEISGGIGVVVSEVELGAAVIEVMSGNPAETAGVKVGDIIVSIDGKDIKGFSIDEASKLIRGDIGSKVNLGILRENTILNLSITRAVVVSTPVESKVIDQSIGYIKLKEFNQNATKMTLKALKSFDDANIKNIIFDVRDNPGGYLSSVLEISKRVIPSGSIVHIKESNGTTVTHSSFNKNTKYKIAVITNENSASAAEIFAGAVKDRGVGKVIGTKTFGKGTVQDIIQLKSGGAIKLTVAEYFTPNMKKVNGVGIVPDIDISQINDIYKEGKDLAIEESIKFLKNN